MTTPLSPIDPNVNIVPVTPTEPQVTESGWSGRRICIAIIGALAAVAATLAAIFFTMKLSKGEESTQGNKPEDQEIALGEFLQVHNNPKFDPELARVLQGMEEKARSRINTQINNDAEIANVLSN